LKILAEQTRSGDVLLGPSVKMGVPSLWEYFTGLWRKVVMKEENNAPMDLGL
jgi:hypothetical protein